MGALRGRCADGTVVASSGTSSQAGTASIVSGPGGATMAPVAEMGACTLGLDERIVMRRAMRRAAYEQAVVREATRIVEDVLVPTVLREAEDSCHNEAFNILVPHVVISPLPRDLPSSYRRDRFEADVQRCTRAMLSSKGLDNIAVTLEPRFPAEGTVPACSLPFLPALFCLFAALPPQPRGPRSTERCLTLTCSIPPEDGVGSESDGEEGGGGGSLYGLATQPLQYYLPGSKQPSPSPQAQSPQQQQQQQQQQQHHPQRQMITHTPVS